MPAQFQQILPILIVVVVFVFLIILPQRKKNKAARDMMSGLKPGDNIKTIGGIYGKITQVKEDVVVIECGPDKVKLVFAKGAIANVEHSSVSVDPPAELQ